MRSRRRIFILLLLCALLGCAQAVAETAPSGPAAAWKGGSLDAEHHKEWSQGLRWRHGDSSEISLTFDEPRDWTGFDAIRFNLFLAEPTASTCVLLVWSHNDDTEGIDYYSCKMRLDWKGWREFVIPLAELSVNRSPIGWQEINGVTFTASGWGQKVAPRTEVVLDAFAPVTARSAMTTDEDLFGTLDLERPGLEGVRAAIDNGDLPAAKRALAADLRERTSPKWFFDWRDRPKVDLKLPAPEADRAPDQWDYYSRFIALDWKGWKKFSLAKSDFSPKAFVEGKGWKGKRPIGWHWIQYIQFCASGWGLSPDPGVTLQFDDMRLVGPERAVVISDFEGETSNAAGLTVSRDIVKAGGGSGRWENLPATTRVRWDDIPHDWTAFERLEFWVHCDRPSDARLILVLDSDLPQEVAKAASAMRREWSYRKGPHERATIRFEKEIDWAANPTAGEERTHCWNEKLNRHFHFRDLSAAYWRTGNDAYAKEIADQIRHWVASCPPPVLASGNRMANGSCAWQTLTTGIRLADTWPQALYRCLGSPAFDDETLCTIMKSVHQQAKHLIRCPSHGNWLTAESNGLYTAGVLFPEFREARDWRRIALERLYRQLTDEIYPDGMQAELAAGYNNWVVREFVHILELADLNDLRDEMPEDYLAKIEKCFDYQLYASRPDGRIPGLNDSGPAYIRTSLAKGAELFPAREDVRYVATAGREGRTPERTSCAFPWTGHYVMRSGWDPGATFLLFDGGPFGLGHQHEDKLHFVLYAHGRPLILDPGNFMYDRSRWRRYVLSTRAHNTVLVDGQDQHRRGKRSTYVWPLPWEGEAPAGNDTTWVSTREYDLVDGVYRDGYGRKREIDLVHRRRLLWIKPDVFVVVDLLMPNDEKAHRYEALFHLNGAEADVDGLAVTTRDDGAANVRIVALPDDRLSLEVVKGREEEPVQGWSGHPWRAVPTAIYRIEGAGAVRMAFVIAPRAKGVTSLVKDVSIEDGIEDGLAGTVRTVDGATHRFVFPDAGPVTVETRDASGEARRRWTAPIGGEG